MPRTEMDTMLDEGLPREAIMERYLQMQADEAGLPVKQFWCSMADPDLPEGSQFLGAVVVNANGVATATHELNMKGLNLGGEIMFTEIPEGKRIPDEWTYRVMNKEEALNCSVVEGELRLPERGESLSEREITTETWEDLHCELCGVVVGRLNRMALTGQLVSARCGRSADCVQRIVDAERKAEMNART